MLVIPDRHAMRHSLPCDGHARYVSGNSGMKAAGAVIDCLFDGSDGDACGAQLLRSALDSIRGTLTSPYGSIVEKRQAKRAKAYIEANLRDRYTALDLARNMGMSRRALQDALSAEGENPAKLSRQVWLERARQFILDDHELSLGEIALRAGLNDGAALSRAFRAEFGMTPRAARDHMGGGLMTAATAQKTLTVMSGSAL